MISEQEIRSMIKEIGFDADVEVLKKNVPLAEQGVDSLDMSHLLLLLEQKLNRSIPDQEAVTLKTIDDLLRLTGDPKDR